MQYMLLIYEAEEAFGGQESDAWNEIVQAHVAYSEELARAGVLRGGAGLQLTDTARTLRKKSGAYAVIDGPFAESKEALGGYYLIDVPDIETAVDWARKLPLHADGAVEVRPVIEMDPPG